MTSKRNQNLTNLHRIFLSEKSISSTYMLTYIIFEGRKEPITYEHHSDASLSPFVLERHDISGDSYRS